MITLDTGRPNVAIKEIRSIDRKWAQFSPLRLAKRQRYYSARRGLESLTKNTVNEGGVMQNAIYFQHNGGQSAKSTAVSHSQPSNTLVKDSPLWICDDQFLAAI